MRRLLFSCLSLLAFPVCAGDVPVLGRHKMLPPPLHEPEAALTATVGGVAGMRFHDNLYRSPSRQESDFIGVFRPGFTLQGELQPYTLAVEGLLERGQYLSHRNNDYTDGDLKWRLAYDREQGAVYYTDGRYRYDHVEIGAFADDPQARTDEPSTYRYLEGGLGGEWEGESWLGRLEGRSFLYNYDNAQRLDGTPYLNDDRDYAQHALTARAGYKFRPQIALFAQASLNARQYDKRIDTTLAQPHDSSGHELLAGLSWNRGDDPWHGEIALGYLNQDYDAAGLEDVAVPALRAGLQWRPAELWRLRAEITRDIREAILADTSSYVQSRARLRTDYRLNPLWRIGGSLRYTENDFQVTPGSGRPARIDNIWDGGVYFDYLLAGEYTLGAEYLRVSRDSDDPASVYDANIFLLRLGVNY